MRRHADDEIGQAAWLLMRKGILLSGMDMSGRRATFYPLSDPHAVVRYAREVDDRIAAALEHSVQEEQST